MSRTLLKLSLLLCLVLGSMSDAFSEGAIEVGSNQRVQASTVLAVDILAIGESITWNGLGGLAVVNPDGVVVANLSDGQSHLCDHVGSYSVELSESQPVDVVWDIEVSGASVGFGRLHSRRWDFDADGYAESNAAYGSFYALVSGGVGEDTAVVELRLQGLAGFRYTIGANATGVSGPSAGQSVATFGNSFVPEYSLYLNPPEIANYQTTAPEVASFSYIGAGADCEAILPGESIGSFAFNANVQGTYHLQCDTNQDGLYDASDSSDLLLVGVAEIGANVVAWDGTSSGGQPVPLGTYECRILLGVGELHYVGEDIETVFAGLRMFSVVPAGNGGFVRTGLDMYWNDSAVQANAVLMSNGEYGIETSGADGVNAGNYDDITWPNQNARSWGEFPRFFGSGKGDRAFLDTFANLDAAASGSVEIEAVDGSGDCDGDGVSDFEEECVLGTAVCQGDIDGDSRDTDADGVCDGSFSVPGICQSGPDEYPLDPLRCRDIDEDSCDDCSRGIVNVSNDGPDRDFDGICDYGEDSDGDTILDGVDVDDDNDGISDEAEGFGDADSDGVPNALDLDSDQDGIFDIVEGQVSCVQETPSDGRCHGIDADRDGRVDDVLKNLRPPDTDGDGAVDPLDLDSDNDGALDLEEASSDCVDITPWDGRCDGGVGDSGVSSIVATWASNGTELPDFDGDGVPNYLDLDSDNDARTDRNEVASGCADADDNGVCDLPDSDGDGVVDSIDRLQGPGVKTGLRAAHSDWDGFADYLDIDSNADGNLDLWQSACSDLLPSNGMCDGTDADSDGIVDSEDGYVGFGRTKDTDGDGVADAFDVDDDGDGLLDVHEGDGEVDSDGDGVYDSLDLDSDNDGILDSVESLEVRESEFRFPSDTDGDGICDYRDLDSDNDGIGDLREATSMCPDMENDGRCDGQDRDRDGIVLSMDNSFGFGVGTMSGMPIDTDNDMTPDYLDLDSDNDGLPDSTEAKTAAHSLGSSDSDGDGTPDQREWDSDGDGILDTIEAGTNRERPVDTDRDGLRDFQDLDSDNDGVFDDTDNCRLIVNPLQIDIDNNGVGQACDEEEKEYLERNRFIPDRSGCVIGGLRTDPFSLLVIFAILCFGRRRNRAVTNKFPDH